MRAQLGPRVHRDLRPAEPSRLVRLRLRSSSQVLGDTGLAPLVVAYLKKRIAKLTGGGELAAAAVADATVDVACCRRRSTCDEHQVLDGAVTVWASWVDGLG